MSVDEKVKALATELEPKTIARRRDIHKHPETGWTEFRTTCIVVKQLQELGYEVYFGEDVTEKSECMGVPDEKTLEREMQRAIDQGADPELVAKMVGGRTGALGVMHFAKPGNTVALRFDIDALPVDEADDDNHRPKTAGFRSVNKSTMHACGHDGHTSIGLAIAEILANMKDELCGTIKLIFQPAEEGVRGARGMTAKGIVDDVDYLIGSHLAMPKIGYLAYDCHGILATSKFNVDFIGVPAHAGSDPDKGRNAILAAATATLNIHSIAPSAKGSTRATVGLFNAGTSRNVIAGKAHLECETRGETTELNDYVYNRAMEIIDGAAKMYGVEYKVTNVGSAAAGNNTIELSEYIRGVAERLGIFDRLETVPNVGASEDCAYFMERVQQNGGQAAYINIGASQAAINHNCYFDFDEHVMAMDEILLATTAIELLAKKKD